MELGESSTRAAGEMIRVLDEEGHPVVGELLVVLRDAELQRDAGRFREALRSLGRILAYEVARALPQRVQEVASSLGRRLEPVLAEDPILAVILRAGIGLWEGFLDLLPRSPTSFIGAARREIEHLPETGRLDIDLSYLASSRLDGRTLIYVDPMLATGSTLRAVHPLLVERAGRPARVFVAGVIAWRPTLATIASALDADVIVASADEELDARGYIVPGLGDAGDLAYGGKI